MPLQRIVLTSGEPAGIGPDCCVTLAQRDWDFDLIVAGDLGLLRSTAQALGANLQFEPYDRQAPPRKHRAGHLRVLHIPTPASVTAGRLEVANAPYVLALLDRACDGALAGEFAAMVTAPVQKSILLDAGFAFSGHTEYLAGRSGAPLPVMLLVAGELRVALVTTHLALAEVPAAITKTRLEATLRIVHSDLIRRFGLREPRIMVLGLNPHAGESGHLGREELDTLSPVIERLQQEGLRILGPLPADTAFTPHKLLGADVVVAMYHDQGLPVIKHVGFGHAVNVTLGLPFIRTSVDHGTALELARTGQADTGSLAAALRLATQLH
jgi:4-hydroxythreonine-4-phosphate dehydrogenase